jgi:hypothetical protein
LGLTIGAHGRFWQAIQGRVLWGVTFRSDFRTQHPDTGALGIRASFYRLPLFIAVRIPTQPQRICCKRTLYVAAIYPFLHHGDNPAQIDTALLAFPHLSILGWPPMAGTPVFSFAFLIQSIHFFASVFHRFLFDPSRTTAIL